MCVLRAYPDYADKLSELKLKMCLLLLASNIIIQRHIAVMCKQNKVKYLLQYRSAKIVTISTTIYFTKIF